MQLSVDDYILGAIVPMYLHLLLNSPLVQTYDYICSAREEVCAC